MIRIDGLRLSLGQMAFEADLHVKAGEICALIGPSGAGKSTILNALAGFLPHAPGNIFLNGEDVVGKAPAQRPVSMLFQDHNLFPHLSIQDNVGLGLSPSLKLTQADHVSIREALSAVSLEAHASKKPRALSGGERQRAGLARALIRQQPILLLDEPFAALGPALRKEMLRLVTDLASVRGLTVLMVTHDPQDAKVASHVTAFMEDGRLAGAHDTTTLFSDPPEAMRAYLG